MTMFVKGRRHGFTNILAVAMLKKDEARRPAYSMREWYGQEPGHIHTQRAMMMCCNGSFVLGKILITLFAWRHIHEKRLPRAPTFVLVDYS
jgi:hypothetical protein